MKMKNEEIKKASEIRNLKRALLYIYLIGTILVAVIMFFGHPEATLLQKILTISISSIFFGLTALLLWRLRYYL